MHSDAYCELLALINEAHVTTLRRDKASLSNVSFLLGLFSGDLTPEEYAELHALLVTK